MAVACFLEFVWMFAINIALVRCLTRLGRERHASTYLEKMGYDITCHELLDSQVVRSLEES